MATNNDIMKNEISHHVYSSVLLLMGKMLVTTVRIITMMWHAVGVTHQ